MPTTTTPTICLNMIVKNESKIIKRLLNSVVPLIDTYCICDTGSTDNTVEIIETFFREKNITGKIVHEPFRDFGYNRTFSMQQCREHPNSDYLLLIDADMILEIDPKFSITNFKNSLKSDAYHLFQGSPSFYYKNVRILRNNSEYSYWGVTHEYVKTPPHTTYETIDRSLLFINDVGDGGSKTEKLSRDIALLERGLEEHPNDPRYLFYLANSYRDTQQYVKSIELYRKRIEIGGWKEEIWYSYYSIGKCYVSMNEMEKAIGAWLDAYDYFPDRSENLYEIVSYYRRNGKNKLAYKFYQIAKIDLEKKTEYDHLFLEKSVYDYLFEYQLTLFGYYYNPDNYDLVKPSMRILANETANLEIQKNVLSNYKFYAPKLKPMECQHKHKDFTYNYEVLQSIGETLDIDRDIFVSSTPSIFYEKGKSNLIVNVRFVNYRIGENGEYLTKDSIITINVVAFISTSNTYRWVKTGEYKLEYETAYDNKYVGLEDVRLYSNLGRIGYSANRGIEDKIMVETGIISRNYKGDVETKSVAFMRTNENRNTEKNWVFFLNSKREPRIVYEWNKLTVGIIPNYPDQEEDVVKSKKLQMLKPNDTPFFFKWVRGSTNGLSMEKGEVWFICHLVSNEDRRYYYHIVVVLDDTTYELKRYSKIFTFEGEKVEYTLGFIYIEELKQFMIGYSTMDRETKYMLISRSKLEDLFL